MYIVDVDNKGTGIFNVKARENEMAIEPMGKGFSPGEVLMASLGSCIGYFIRAYAKQANLEIKEFSIHLESDFTKGKALFGMKEQPLAMREITASIDLKGALDPRRTEALLRFVASARSRPRLKSRIPG
jgi:uncharacterized OsmC-like protein